MRWPRSQRARRDDFERFVAGTSRARRLRRLPRGGRAHRLGWRSWPSSRSVPEGPVDPDRGLHRFVQYVAANQLARRRRARSASVSTSTCRSACIPTASTPGRTRSCSRPPRSARRRTRSPPAARPGASRRFIRSGCGESGYRYLIAALREALRFARAIRIDHILGLQRLYWIPPGADATAGRLRPLPARGAARDHRDRGAPRTG